MKKILMVFRIETLFALSTRAISHSGRYVYTIYKRHTKGTQVRSVYAARRMSFIVSCWLNNHRFAHLLTSPYHPAGKRRPQLITAQTIFVWLRFFHRLVLFHGSLALFVWCRSLRCVRSLPREACFLVFE